MNLFDPSAWAVNGDLGFANGGFHGLGNLDELIGRVDGLEDQSIEVYTSMDSASAMNLLDDDDMFTLYNAAFLDDAIVKGKPVEFSHNPVGDGGYLGVELRYLEQHGYRYDADSNIAYPPLDETMNATLWP